MAETEATTAGPPQPSTATKTLKAACYCKAVQFTVTVPTAELPLGVHLCHCPVCRYTHGTLSIFHAPLPRGVEPVFVAPSSKAALTGYTHETHAAAERFFCSTCGCHIGDEDLEPEGGGEGPKEWRVASSLFEDHGEDVFQIRTHIFTEAAPGGLHEWLPKIGDREMRLFNPAPGSSMFPMPRLPPPKQEFDDQGNERLRAECHCGGVSFTIGRPTKELAEDPYISTFISPLDPQKWLAVLDVCDDCRLMDGTHVVPWAFVPIRDTQPRIPSDFKFGTLKTFKSSEGVLRAFCGTCGATVIFSCDERSPNEDQHIIDVSVGILRAPEGVNAANWLTWRTGRLAFGPSGQRYDAVFADSLAKAFDEWGKKEYGESPTFSVG